MSSDGDNNTQSSAEGNTMSEHFLGANEGHSCRAMIENTRDICGETEGLRILDQFRKIYEAKMEKIERDEATGIGADLTHMKLDIMKEWIKDLGEQNVMLVRTVEELEEAACYRVKVLEEKLRETAGIVSEKMSKLAKPSGDTVISLSTRIFQLEKEEEILQQKIEFLKSDIRGLLELIRRARCENCWCLKGIKFFEIRSDDIPSVTECSCTEAAGDNENLQSLKSHLEVLRKNEEKARKYQAELEEKVSDLDGKLMSREKTIEKYVSMLKSLRDNLKKRWPRNNQTNLESSHNSGADFEFDIGSIMEMVESEIARRSGDKNERGQEVAMKTNNGSDEIDELRAKLQDKSLEIERLSRHLSILEKESLETREALTNEVAEKHDMGMALRAEVATLEEQCRRANMLMQFKEDIIKELRRELKQRSANKGAGSSGRKVRINADVVYCDQPEEASAHVTKNRQGQSNLVSDLNKAKASWKRENEALYYLRTELEEVLEELHAKEREDYERDMASAHTKLRDIGTLLDNYKTEVIDRNDTKRETRQTDKSITIQKLSKSIANLSKVCAENGNGIILLERALEKSEKADTETDHDARVNRGFNERWKWDVFDRQFRAMEEFRVCTVEAQAATENLREDMEIVVCNLQTRHQRYLDLSNSVKQMQRLLMGTKENVSEIMCRLEKQEEEKICHNEKVATGEAKLKDLKNEINKARSECRRDVVDFAGQRENLSPRTDHNASRDVIDKMLETVEQVVHHLRSLRSQDQCGNSLLSELRNELYKLESNLDEVHNETNKVLSDTEIAQDVFNEKIQRLDKFERELDYAHTKMQDTLESIAESRQRMIDDGFCNLCSCTSSETAIPSSEATTEERHKNSSVEVEQLKNALRSKEKLLEDKDEIIRIQKDSITMTHVELKDLHQKMQSKIDAQNVAIVQHVEEKKLLLEQSKLQSQTIGHLREAVVEAKRCLATQQQKSTLDLSVSECCDKDETIRLLALYLRETQAQYNDCFSETHIMAEFDVTLTSKYITTNLNVLKAAAQDSQLELQRQAIDNLQKTIICKDLVYYSLLIKMQEFFRGRIGDVRLVRSKMDNLERSRKYLEDKCRRLKRLWREADRELRRIKCITSYDTDCQHSTEYKDSSTWTNDLEFTGSAEMEAKINFLLRENEDLKKQLRSRSLEMEIFDEEVKNQLNDNNLGPESADTRSKGNCSSNENVELEFVLKEHLACARILIEELLRAKERETSKIDSTTSNQTNINCTSINDQLYRKNLELDELFAEAKDKQEELGVLKDMRKQFEKSENLERMNDCLKKELFNLQRDAEKECCPREKVEDNANSQNIETDQSICSGNVKSRERGISSMEELKDQLSSTRELTEECLAELRVSKETLSFLRERISSLKKLLKEKSDEMVKLQADHQMIKNDCSILKSENRTFAEEARAEIQEFRDKLKALESELHLVDENYQRVSEDFDKSQKLLIDATNREVKLQHGLTAMEQIFYSKLSSAEREGKRLSDLVDNLRADLENARYELSTREEDYVEKCRDAYEQVESLEDQVALLEESKCLLTRQLQESRFENCRLMAENSRLMESGCKFVKELEDTQNALLELNSECKTKTRTLNSISAELNYVAASRSELCDESQRVVARIRSWIEEQRRLVESLSKKLKNEKNRIARYAFEKKALVATVNELTRVNGTLSEFSIGRKMCREHSPNLRYARSNGYETPASYKRAQKSVAASSTTVYTRPFKRRCVYSTKISRRTLLRGNSWWFPKLEHVSKELSRKNRRYEEKENEGSPSETSVDEARDFGYQSSASK